MKISPNVITLFLNDRKTLYDDKKTQIGYRELVASKIPELAQQVIILVSASQWRGEVKTACEDRVGEEHNLNEFH